MKRSTLASRLLEAGGAGQRKKILATHASLADGRLARLLKDECYRVWTAEPAQARRVADVLKALSEIDRADETLAMKFWVEGISDITRGKLESAVDHLDQATQLLSRIGNQHESAQPQVAKLIALAMLGRYEEAQTAGRRALRIFERFDDQLAAGKIEMNLSNVVSRRDEYRLAERYCLSAYQRFEKLGETKWKTMAENGLANTYAELNDFKRAELFYSRALASARRAGMNLTVAEIEASIGNLALFRGSYADALRSLERSRQIYERLGMPHQTAIAELEIADIYAEINLNDEAIEIYRRLVPTLRRLKLRAEQARAHANYGAALVAAGDARTARVELRKASALFAAEQNIVAAAAVDLRRAALESASGNLVRALDTVERSLVALEESGNTRLFLSAKWLRGDVLARLGRDREARVLLESTLRSARRTEHPAIAQATMNSLGVIARTSGDTSRAVKFFEMAIESAEAARAPLPGEQFRMAFLAKALEPYRNLTQLYLSEGLIRKAFESVEQSRARSLLEGIAGSNSSGGMAAKLREELNRYYALLDRAEDDERPRLEKEIRKREKRLATDALRYQSTATHRRKGPIRGGIDLPRLQKRLGKQRALIEFVEDAGVFSAFVVTNERIDFASSVASHEDIMPLLEGLHFQFGAIRFGSSILGSFASQLKSRTDLYLEKLYDNLLAPLAELYGSRDLVIVPAGALNYVPFRALVRDGRYVIEDRDVTSAPSASVWLRLNSHPPAHVENALLIGYADERIPLVTREVRTLARQLPNGLGLTGRKATFDAFRESAAAFDVIHIACHGQFRPDNPMFSSLHLADGWVTVRDVCSERISARLVTLSACETGLNKVYAGEEILGLARGFLSTGARSLVLSLWTVNDKATLELMSDLYANLQRGLGVSASLTIAQRKFIRRGDHPYFWAPFFAIE